MSPVQRNDILAFIDGFLTAQMVLGRDTGEAFARWDEQMGPEFGPALQQYRRQKSGLSERIYFTGDFVGSGAKATEWVRGVARAALLDPEFVEQLTAREDDVPHLFRAIFLGLTLDERGAADQNLDPGQREALRLFQAQAQKFQAELHRVQTHGHPGKRARRAGLGTVRGGGPRHGSLSSRPYPPAPGGVTDFAA